MHQTAKKVWTQEAAESSYILSVDEEEHSRVQSTELADQDSSSPRKVPNSEPGTLNSPEAEETPWDPEGRSLMGRLSMVGGLTSFWSGSGQGGPLFLAAGCWA